MRVYARDIISQGSPHPQFGVGENVVVQYQGNFQKGVIKNVHRDPFRGWMYSVNLPNMTPGSMEWISPQYLWMEKDIRRAKRIVSGAWVELDRESPYHIEQKPVGHDRKTHEGPLPTQEDFCNTWLPTGKYNEATPLVEKIEVVQIEIAARHANDQILPGVPRSLFRAWESAHDAEIDFDSTHTVANLEKVVHYLLQFIREGERVGLKVDPRQLKVIQHYVQNNRPSRGDEYGHFEAEDALRWLDGILNRVHGEVCHLTNTDRNDWYEIGAEQMKSAPSEELLTEDERKQMGLGYKTQPYKGDPSMREMWERKKRHELFGRRVRAIDVIRKREAPAVEGPMTDIEEPPPETPVRPPVHPAVERLNNVVTGDPAILAMTIGEAGEWSEQEEGEGVAGSIFAYQKSIYLDEDQSENRLEIYAFVEPILVRKRRLQEEAKRLRTVAPERARSSAQEAAGMPDRGYINDIEIFYNDGELLFHRERAFTPKMALSEREFMAGDAMQRAITDLQQFVRTQIDPVPVGKFIEAALRNPGKGEGKLSMRVTAADVLEFDPNKRRLKELPKGPRKGPRKGPLRAPTDIGPGAGVQEIPFGPKRVEAPGMEEAFEEDMRQMGGDTDYEGLLYMFDTAAGGLNDIAEAMIRLQPTLDPQRQKESGAIIAKIKAAIRALSA